MEIKCSVFTQDLRVFWISTVDFFVYGKCGYYTDLFGGQRLLSQKQLQILFHRSDSGDAELFYQHVRHAGA